jgi:hypothetical protein
MDAVTALNLLAAMLREAAALSTAINKARAEGRDNLTSEEVDAFAGRAVDSRARLQARIDALPAD